MSDHNSLNTTSDLSSKDSQPTVLKQKIKIINKLGLHARAAMKLVNLASRYQSDILIRYQDKEVNAKSVMNVMVLAAACGAEIEVLISGFDETEAMESIVALINDRFGEGQ